MDTKHRNLIRDAIERDLPAGAISTRDMRVPAMSSTKLSVTMAEIEQIVNEMLIEQLIKDEVFMSNASHPDEITEYRDERIADILDDPSDKWRWYCATCGKLMLDVVNQWIPEDERYCECE